MYGRCVRTRVGLSMCVNGECLRIEFSLYGEICAVKEPSIIIIIIIMVVVVVINMQKRVAAQGNFI